MSSKKFKNEKVLGKNFKPNLAESAAEAEAAEPEEAVEASDEPEVAQQLSMEDTTTRKIKY